MEKTIIINAGHSISDPGATAHNTTEAKEAMKIRDKLVPLLKRNFKVEVVPDELNLIDSIKWVNDRFNNLDDGLAFSIHLNASGGTGAEILYYDGNEESRKMAKTIIDKYCSLTRFRNRGVKPDTGTRHGELGLGWIRKVKPWSLLIECCFIDNEDDIKRLQEECDEIAGALYLSICEVYKLKPVYSEDKKEDVTKSDIVKTVKEQIEIKSNEILNLAKKL